MAIIKNEIFQKKSNIVKLHDKALLDKIDEPRLFLNSISLQK